MNQFICINSEKISPKLTQIGNLLSEFSDYINAVKSKIYLHEIIDGSYNIEKELDKVADYLRNQIISISTTKELLECDFNKLLNSRYEFSKDIPYSKNIDNPKRFMWSFPSCWRKSSGVYMLWENENLVYIGQSQDCVNRIFQHKSGANSKNKNVTHASIFPMQIDSSKNVERILIKHFKPKNNVRFK